MTAEARRHRIMLREVYADRAGAIRDRLREFSEVSPDQHIYELIFCLLTPQSQARHADTIVRILIERNFAGAPFDPEPLLRDPKHYIRFHRTKAARLQRIIPAFPVVREILREDLLPSVRRDRLVRHVDGFGMKEATHFLRNIGRNDGLAILDRHILRHLVRSGVIPDVPASLSTKTYLEIEKRFRRFARSMNIPIDELDLLFWSLQTGEILK